MGTVYIFFSRESGTYKIGFTQAKDAKKRLSGVKNGHPFPLESVREYPVQNPRQLERTLHALVADKWVQGEWFRLVESDLDACDTAVLKFTDTAREVRKKARAERKGRFPISLYVRTPLGWRYRLAVLDGGMPVPNMIVVDGGMEHHPEGIYYFRVNRKWVKAGKTPQDVVDAMLRNGEPPLPDQPKVWQPAPEQPNLWQTAMRWLESYNIGKADRTKQAMELVLKNFLSVTKVSTIRDITADHVRAYWQYEVDHSPTKSYRTAHNRVTSLGAFLKAHDVVIKWKIPAFVEETPEVFEQEEIDALFGVCDQRHRAAYSTMFKALLREKECVYLTRDCVDVKRCIIRVKAHPEYGFKPKKNYERSVSVPRELIDMITALPNNGPLVFGKDDGSPDDHLLRYMKDAAKRAGLDPDHVWLHKLRASGCTRLLQSGMPLPDVMRLGGWRDLASVQRYMGLLNHDRTQAAVEAAWA